LIGGWQFAVGASLLGFPWRAGKQLNIIGSVGIKSQVINVGAFERLGRGSKPHRVAMRRNLDEVNQLRLPLASSDHPLDGPRIELNQRCVEDEVRDQGYCE